MAKKKQLQVQQIIVNWQTIDHDDFISLTDMAKSLPRPDQVIGNWLRNRNTLRFLAAWERMRNPDFKIEAFDELMEHAGENAFTLSPSEWVKRTGAIGVFTKMGRGGGTYGEKLIAFEFGSFISAEFKLYLITEFDRLKEEESERKQLGWKAERFLAKRNYALQTEAIKRNLLPQSEYIEEDQWLEFASEADLLNVVVFRMTAKQFRDRNPSLAKQGLNLRDQANTIELLVLSNLEAINAELIRQAVPKGERFVQLSQAAIFQFATYYQDQMLAEKSIQKNLPKRK